MLQINAEFCTKKPTVGMSVGSRVGIINRIIYKYIGLYPRDFRDRNIYFH
jgi:hypothetical protein